MNKRSNLLSTINYDDNVEIIYTDKDEGKIEKINKNIFNCFDYKNNVKSDYYFNLVSIYAFENLMKDFNYELVKQEFKRYGYKVLTEGELSNIKLIDIEMSDPEELIMPKSNLNKSLAFIIKNIIDINPKYKDRIYNVKLSEILPERTRTEKSIKYRLEKDNIEGIKNLLNYNMRNITEIYGVGESSILDFKKNIIKGIESIYGEKTLGSEVKIDPKDIELKNYIDFLINADENIKYLLKTINIKNLLSSSTETEISIIKKLEADNIETALDLKEYDIRKIKEINGVGKKRFGDTIKKIRKQIELEYSKFKNINEGKFSVENIAYERIKEYTILQINNIIYADNPMNFDGEILDITIKDIQNKKYQEIDTLKNRYDLSKLNFDLNNLLDINKLLRKTVPIDISKRDKDIIYKRIILNKTLYVLKIMGVQVFLK